MLGGGLEIALAADIRIAGRSAKLGAPEVQRGWVGGGGASQMLPRVVGVGKAMQMLLGGEPVSADEARAIGLVEEVLDDAAADVRAAALAAMLAGWSTVATQAVKAAVRASLEMPLSAGLRYENELHVVCMQARDRHEGIKAFQEKRAGRFDGNRERPTTLRTELTFMAAFDTERVLSVHHWNETLFTFTCTRNQALRFESGHFVMVGLEVDGKPLMRAYSIASAHYEESLEFFSIKVENGPLTSRLQHLKVGDPVLIGRKPTGTLVLSDLLPGENLFLFSTGTGLAPFMSIIRDPDTYERFRKVVLVHGVRIGSELAYANFIADELPKHDYLGEQVREKLIYYPTVTREPFRNQGRLTTLIENGKLCSDIGMPKLDPSRDRAMICGGRRCWPICARCSTRRALSSLPASAAPATT